VILINLLPHREEKRKRRKAAFFLGLGLAAAAGLVAVGLWYVVLQQLIDGQVGELGELIGQCLGDPVEVVEPIDRGKGLRDMYPPGLLRDSVAD